MHTIRDRDGALWHVVKAYLTSDIYDVQRVGFHSEQRKVTGQELYYRWSK